MIGEQEVLDHLNFLRGVKYHSEKGKKHLQKFFRRSHHSSLNFLARLAYFVLAKYRNLTPEDIENIEHRRVSKHKKIFRKYFYSVALLKDTINRPSLLQSVLMKIAFFIPLITSRIVLRNIQDKRQYGYKPMAKSSKTTQ